MPMSPLGFLVHTAAVVVAVTGVRKLVDPDAISAALATAGLPDGPGVGRLIGAVEVAIGIGVLAAGGRLPALALALLYGGFLAFIAVNRLRGLDVPCGCVGESTAPPGLLHVAIDAVAAAGAATAVAVPVGAAADWPEDGWAGLVGLAGVVVAAALVVVALEVAARRDPQGS
jgi:hypothetical protein